MRVVLKKNIICELQSESGMTDQNFAVHIGISRSQLWRAKLPSTDKRFSLGHDFIAKVLHTFHDKKFEQLFSIEHERITTKGR
ncbi:MULTISPECIES: hypothetical protein [Paenibacillus]|uniref:hypothetical protein n=1 Tax=Paenibacillus TaxID=44249 RepID=UPI0022B8EDCE|nr:hypothetical protein [Paenibacillus caseinilyticus]MCZ8520162.1 hypothetical protein [Paenibacillus caseinilyticus]